MSTLADYRAKIRALLDVEAPRYKDSLLDACLSRALGRYSKAAPDVRQEDLTLAVAGRTQSLGSLLGVQMALEVRGPVLSGAEPPALRYYFFWRSGIPKLFVGGGVEPSAGDVLRVVYAANHSISGLDGALATTVRDQHAGELAGGAAAYAVMARAASMVETYGSKLAEPTPMFDWARAGQEQFHTWLSELKEEKTGVAEFLPTLCWSLDAWDRG